MHAGHGRARSWPCRACAGTTCRPAASGPGRPGRPAGKRRSGVFARRRRALSHPPPPRARSAAPRAARSVRHEPPWSWCRGSPHVFQRKDRSGRPCRPDHKSQQQEQSLMTYFQRQALMDKFQGMVRRGEPIVGGGAGTGISAKCEEAAGIDLIVVYNSGRYRMAGRGSLAGLMPYGNANQIVKEMAFEVLTAVEKTPVLAGVCGTDPFMLLDYHLHELKALGFAGIQNFPTVGLMDGMYRENLEETGMSYQLEVDCIAAARKLDMLTTPYAFNVDEAKRMTEAGADIIVAHM